MPIHLDSHTPEVDLTPGTAKSDIVAFLYHNSEFGYRPTEVADHLELPEGTVTTTLLRLHEQEYVGKTVDSHYHAFADRDDIHRYVSSLDQLDRMFADRDRQSTGNSTDVPQSESNESYPTGDDDELEAELTELEDEIRSEDE